MTLFKKNNWVTVQEAADILEVSTSRIYNLIRSGRFQIQKNKFYRKHMKVSLRDIEGYRIEREAV